MTIVTSTKENKYQPLNEVKLSVPDKESSQTNDSDGNLVRLLSDERSRWTLKISALWIAAILVLLLMYCIIYIPYHIRHSAEHYGDTLWYKKPLAGHPGVSQTVRASVEQNFVEYYISSQVSDKTWIIDDFNNNLEIIKSEADGQVLCYVTQLNITEAMHPTKVSIEQLAVEKQQHHGILTPDTYPVTNKSFLGARGLELCKDVEVYWLHPMDDVMDLSEANPHINSSIDLSSALGRSGRSKRNIPACHASCCWLVCCCDVHHFKWESSEYFTCRHVCDKCTQAYKQKIQKMC